MRRGRTTVSVPILRSNKMEYVKIYNISPDVSLTEVLDSFRRKSSSMGMFTYNGEFYCVIDNYLLKKNKVILYREGDSIIINDASALFLRQDHNEYASIVISYGYTLQHKDNSFEKDIFLNTSEADLDNSNINKYLKAAIALL